MLVGLRAPETGTQYSATEYTREIADVRSTGAGAPQSVPASLLIMLKLGTLRP